MIIMIDGVIVSSDEKWIYDYFGISAVCPRDVTKQLNEADGEDVEVTINSNGGDIFAGSEIYEALRAYKGKVVIKVVGLAASAASVIACARTSEISPTAMLMIHNVSALAEGDYNAMDKMSDVLKQANKALANAYVNKTGKTLEEVLDLMNKETWITSGEAVEMGFIDKVSDSREDFKLAAAFNSGLLPREVIRKYKNQRATQKAQAQLDLLKLKI